MYSIFDIKKILKKDTYFLKNKYKFSGECNTNELTEYIKNTENIHGISLGLCCINTILRNGKKNDITINGIKKDIFTSRKMIRANFTVDKAKSLALENLRDLYYMLKWNDKYGISVFRLSSEIFPRFTDTECEKYDISFAKKYLRNIGKLVKSTNQRVLMHPGQYNQVGAKDDKVFRSTIYELKHHADILDAMGIGDEGVLIVHGGGVYGDKETTKKRWVSNFKKLPLNVQKRLVLENCEKSYSPRDCLDICKELNIPMIFDTFHYDCYKKLHPDEELETPKEFLPEVLDTWKGRKWKVYLPFMNGQKIVVDRPCPPVFHVSEQGSGRVGHHSDYIEKIPQYLLDIPKRYNIDIHIEIEAKMKEQAIYYLYDKYSSKKYSKK